MNSYWKKLRQPIQACLTSTIQMFMVEYMLRLFHRETKLDVEFFKLMLMLNTTLNLKNRKSMLYILLEMESVSQLSKFNVRILRCFQLFQLKANFAILKLYKISKDINLIFRKSKVLKVKELLSNNFYKI